MSDTPFHSLIRGVAGRIVRTPTRVVGTVSESLKRRHCVVGVGSVLLGSSRLDNLRRDRSAISIGSNSQIAGQLLIFAHGGSIRIGNDCFVGEGSRIWSSKSITIGNRVLISHGVNVHDTNAHSTSARNRHQQIASMFSSGHPIDLPDVPDSPIDIEDDVWIGFNAIVLKGVRIGCGSVVGAAALVSKDVPPFSIMVGNPARCIGSSRP